MHHLERHKSYEISARRLSHGRVTPILSRDPFCPAAIVCHWSTIDQLHPVQSKPTIEPPLQGGPRSRGFSCLQKRTICDLRRLCHRPGWGLVLRSKPSENSGHENSQEAPP